MSPRLVRFLKALQFVGLATVAQASGTHSWNSATGNWSDPTKWSGGVPSGTDPTDILAFAGTGAVTYTSTNNIAATPFLLDQIQLNSSASVSETIAGNGLKFAGANRSITQIASGAFNITTPIQSSGTLTLAGAGVGAVTLSGGLSGVFDITKNEASPFRYGSATATSNSENRWFGTLTINAGPASPGNNNGAIRFNNNAYTAPTALRANPIVLTSLTASITTLAKAEGIDPDSSLRFGTLSGTAGYIEARRDDATPANGQFDSASIIITALSDGAYAGILTNRGTAADGNSDDGSLVVRGVANQTFNGVAGALQIEKDIVVGRGATVTISGAALVNVRDTSKGSIILNGGTFRLDNSGTNVGTGRLRDGTASSTALDTTGGGTFSFVGNASATSTEATGRLQMGAGNTRSGALEINVVHNSGTSFQTNLTFASINRNTSSAGQHATTVDFTNTGGTLGAAGNNPHIVFTSVALTNGLLTSNNDGVLGAVVDVGWATVNGSSFATHNAVTGIAAVATTPFGTSNATANAELNGTASVINPGIFSLNSLKISPSVAGQSLTLGTGADLTTQGILLAGNQDYTINGLGTIGGNNTRYFHVQNATLNVAIAVTGGFEPQPLVKAGDGTLALTGANSGGTFKTVINDGVLRATPGASLPGGELQLRGGVLEITGGGTFARQLTSTGGAPAASINWSGVDAGGAGINEDRGSGGFAANGAGVTLNITKSDATTLAWEDKGFLNSGHALVFGSRTGDARVTWSNDLNLGSTSTTVNYNAREIRVEEHANPAITTDMARMSGVISSANLNASMQLVNNHYNDLLKTGPGTLELTATNTYTSATIVHQGTLLVNGSISGSFLTDVRNGATLGGKGSVGNVLVEATGAGGTLAPGEFAGRTSIFSTKDLTLDGANAKLAIELGGTTAGGNGTSGYDQIQLAGGVTLNGGTLQLSLLAGFNANVSDVFYLILNDGTDAVSGTFAGLAEGAQFQLGGFNFKISYVANGDGGAVGNDVALTIPEPSSAILALLGTAAMLSRRRRWVKTQAASSHTPTIAQ